MRGRKTEGQTHQEQGNITLRKREIDEREREREIEIERERGMCRAQWGQILNPNTGFSPKPSYRARTLVLF